MNLPQRKQSWAEAGGSTQTSLKAQCSLLCASLICSWLTTPVFAVLLPRFRACPHREPRFNISGLLTAFARATS